MPISIYPPTLQSTQPAFLASTNVYQIYFTLQSITSLSDIGHIQIRIVRQSNNRSIVNTSQYPDGTIYKAPSAIGSLGSQYFVSINRNELSEPWTAGYLYKVQMRFGVNAMYNSLSEFATWKQQQIDQDAFSEWSTVMVIKAIDAPEVVIDNDEIKREDVISTERTEATLTPLFYGSYNIDSKNNELLDKYKFDLYSGIDVDQEQLLETSGWLQHNGTINDRDEFRFKTVLTNNENYTVVYSIVTVNGYEAQSDPYTFLASRTYLGELAGVSISIEDDSIYCRENGCIRLYCTTTSNLSGSYVITRSTEDSNYQVWEDIKYLQFNNQAFNNSLIYTDFTIESGIKYKYAIQQENSAGLRTSPVYDATNAPHSVNFEYSYLYRDGVQLRLQFNQTLSSFKHTTLRSKQDTLGDRYPHLVQNGNAYYAEFPISGLISFQMDGDQTFFTLENDGFHYRDELVVPRDKFIETNITRASCKEYQNTENSAGVPTNWNSLSISTSLTDDNIFVERIFREKAEEFLNDFAYKLFKSPTEGNIIIGLLNVSLTPNNTVGRMLYSFSATAYEVLENTIENLNEVNIIDIGSFETLASEDNSYSFGQISGIYGNNIDLYAMIREQEEVSVGGGYKMNLIQVTDILVEQYPKVDLTAQLLEVEALRAEATSAGEDTSEYDSEISRLEGLISVLEGPETASIKLAVNGATIFVAPGRKYHLNENINSLTLVESSMPIVINYVCQLNQVEDLSAGVVSAIDASRIWGQISGIFTGTDKVLRYYNYDYLNSETFRIFSNNGPEELLVRDSQGDIIIDNTTFNLYKIINIYDIIKEETQKQVELIYDTKFELNSEGQLTDGEIYYSFSDIILFDIEADEGTTLYISSNADGSNPVTVKIGPTCRYTLNPMDNMIKYIALAEPQFCVINYKCLTNQMRMKVGQTYVRVSK